MLRTELAAKLDTLAPALMPDAIVPAMAMIWFRGDRAMAYNDTIAISVPLETPFVGAVPGTTLIKVLKASLAREVVISPERNSIEVKAARTRLKLALSGEESFIFTMPKVDNYQGLDFDLGRAFLQAVKDLMLSVGDDPLQADQCGVTVIQDPDGVSLYTTNRSTISHAKLPTLRFFKQDGARVILPTAFCEQMTGFKESPALGLYIGESYAAFYAGKVEVWGRLLTSKDPLDFAAVTKKSIPKEIAMVPVPTNLGRLVERILVVADDKDSSMKMSVENERCSFELGSSRGEIFDSMAVPGHPDAVGMIKPKWVKPVCDFHEMLLTERCLIMRKGNSIYLVSTGVEK